MLRDNTFEGVKTKIEDNDYKNLVVTGPQRSGTQIATKILSHEFDYEEKYERYIDTYNYNKFFTTLNEEEGLCLHAPAMSAFILAVPSDCLVVFLLRPTQEIQESRREIDWNDKPTRAIYEAAFESVYHPSYRTAAIEKEVFNKKQRNKRDNIYPLRYYDLSKHDMWVPAQKREDFDTDQTEK